VAHVFDQFFWGEELERLHVAGTTLRRKGLNSRQLANGIERVLADPQIASQAEALSRLMAQGGGVRTATDLIEKHLDSGR
jgi:UDP:flavonoid glycosyltransferase YjiC (YdhE family)